MMTIEIVYAFFFFVGLAFALGSAFLSGVFTGSEGGAMHTDAGTGGDLDHGTLNFSPLSPVVMAMFLASFGGAGLIAIEIFGATDIKINLPVALGAGFAVSGITTLIFSKLFKATQSSSQPMSGECEGADAEVIIAIPENGLGQIAYSNRGIRFTSSAKSEDNRAIKAHESVVIVTLTGGTAVVKVKT